MEEEEEEVRVGEQRNRTVEEEEVRMEGKLNVRLCNRL